MKIEIWSDVMCPFCYIGKHRFEQALRKFEHGAQVQVVWKSFQLNPDLKYAPGQSLYTYMAKQKGWTEEYTRRSTAHVANMAQSAGLTFDFEHNIPANTFNAHRLLHLAAKYNKQDEAEEIFFRAHFSGGKNLEDPQTLVQLGSEAGIPEEEVIAALNSNAYEKEVHADIAEAQQLGITGVPFFVIDRKYAISGAQPEELFLQALEKAWQERAPELNETGGASCTVDEACDGG